MRASSQAMVLRPGVVLADKYALRREIGRGAVGLVFEAEHLRLRQRYAVKALNGHLRNDAQLVERFEREARAMASLKSPYVTSVFDVDVMPDGTPYMVMELLEGRDLHRELRERGGKMPASELARILVQACEGIAAVHAAGIVHRDLKPSNLFLGRQGPSRVVKVMDFGISKVEGDETNHTGSSVGTPAYMSPEQVRAPREVDSRSDVWSLGVILFRALTGQLPFDGEGVTGMAISIVNHAPKPIRELRPDLPPELAAVVERLLEKDPARRYQTVLEVRDALMPFAGDAASELRAPSWRPVDPPSGANLTLSPAAGLSATVPAARRPVPMSVLAGAAALGLAFAVAIPWVVRRASREPPPIPPAQAEAVASSPRESTPAPILPAPSTAAEPEPARSAFETRSSADGPAPSPPVSSTPPAAKADRKAPPTTRPATPPPPPSPPPASKKPDLPNLL